MEERWKRERERERLRRRRRRRLEVNITGMEADARNWQQNNWSVRMHFYYGYSVLYTRTIKYYSG